MYLFDTGGLSAKPQSWTQPLDLSESAVTPVYDLGQHLSIGLISGIIANDRWCGLVGRGLLG